MSWGLGVGGFPSGGWCCERFFVSLFFFRNPDNQRKAAVFRIVVVHISVRTNSLSTKKLYNEGRELGSRRVVGKLRTWEDGGLRSRGVAKLES